MYSKDLGLGIDKVVGHLQGLSGARMPPLTSRSQEHVRM